MISPQLRAAATKPLILSILARRDRSYGYEIIQIVRRLSGGSLEWKDGMLYPVLHRMERDGLIQSRWRLSDSSRPRKYYTIKPEGRSALKSEKAHWLELHATLQKVWNLEVSLT